MPIWVLQVYVMSGGGPGTGNTDLHEYFLLSSYLRCHLSLFVVVVIVVVKCCCFGLPYSTNLLIFPFFLSCAFSSFVSLPFLPFTVFFPTFPYIISYFHSPYYTVIFPFLFPVFFVLSYPPFLNLLYFLFLILLKLCLLPLLPIQHFLCPFLSLCSLILLDFRFYIHFVYHLRCFLSSFLLIILSAVIPSQSLRNLFVLSPLSLLFFPPSLFFCM